MRVAVSTRSDATAARIMKTAISIGGAAFGKKADFERLVEFAVAAQKWVLQSSPMEGGISGFPAAPSRATLRAGRALDLFAHASVQVARLLLDGGGVFGAELAGAGERTVEHAGLLGDERRVGTDVHSLEGRAR